MNGTNYSKLFLRWILVLFSITFLFGCNKESTNGPNLPTLPEVMPDTIAYDKFPSGKIVFYRIGPLDNNYSGLYVIDFEKKKSFSIDKLCDAPAISPDGKYLAYSAPTPYPTSTYWDIFIYDLDSKKEEKISALVGQERCPSWSPYSDQVLYYADLFSNYTSKYIYTYDLASKMTATSKNLYYFSFFIKTGIISYSKNDCFAFTVSGKGVYTLQNSSSADTNCLLQITKGKLSNSFSGPAYSPDGKKISVLSIYTDTSKFIQTDVIVMDSDGKNKKILVSMNSSGNGGWSGYNNYSVCWSPDGEYLAFINREGGLSSYIYIIKSDGTGLFKLTSAPDVSDLSVSWGR